MIENFDFDFDLVLVLWLLLLLLLLLRVPPRINGDCLIDGDFIGDIFGDEVPEELPDVFEFELFEFEEEEYELYDGGVGEFSMGGRSLCIIVEPKLVVDDVTLICVDGDLVGYLLGGGGGRRGVDCV